MAKHKRLILRTVTTRSQAKSLQEQEEANRKNRSIKKIIKKKQTKRQKQQNSSRLKKRLSMENRKRNEKIPKVGVSPINKNNECGHEKRKYTDPLMIQIQMELEKLRKINNDQDQEFLGDRHVSLSQSSTGKNIQITCKNFIAEDVKKEEKIVTPKYFQSTSNNWSEISTIRIESPNTLNNNFEDNNKTNPIISPLASTSTGDVNINNMSTPKYNPRLSLTSQCKLYLENIQGASTLNDQPNDESDNDVICLDTINESEEMDCIDDDLVCVTNSKSESLILIDDDDNRRTEKTSELVDIIDLTTPIKPLSKVSKPKKDQPINQSEQFVQQIPLIPQRSIPSTSQARGNSVHSEFPLVFNTRLMEPPTILVPIIPQRPQLEPDNSSNYNIHSNIYGNNFLNLGSIRTTGLRPIFIDGNNIAMLHSNGKFFSVIGLKICIDYFKMRGHDVTAIVPQIRKRRKQNSDPKLLFKLEKDGSVIFTPSRVINGKNIVPYDDRFIVQLAAVHQGVVVSCDNYKDLLMENPNLRDVIENRVLNPTFVKNMIIFPSDPLGLYGPKLDDFLKFPSQ